MRRVLLDTHVFLWWLEGNSQLGKFAIKIISDEDNEIYVSAASVWEISIKKQNGLLVAPDNLDSVIDEEGFTKLPISVFHTEQAGCLPLHHRDPFDRMLIAQAQTEGLQLLSKDAVFPNYGINLIDASK